LPLSIYLQDMAVLLSENPGIGWGLDKRLALASAIYLY
jgi:hypothetical protein